VKRSEVEDRDRAQGEKGEDAGGAAGRRGEGRDDETRAADVMAAEVRVGGEVVHYLRSGQGPPVLLLLKDPGSRAPEGSTFAALARDHRVVQPLSPLPRGRDEAEDWICGLVEGLGLRTPDLVASPELAPLLARLVRRNGGLVGQVLFLSPRRRG